MKLNIPAQLESIAQRNALRRECKLPPLDRTYELHRLRTLLELEWEAAFDAWGETTGLRRRVEEKHLTRARRRRADPTWVPAGMINGMDFGLQVEKTLCRLYERDRCRTPAG
jgi:hypothetical protein